MFWLNFRRRRSDLTLASKVFLAMILTSAHPAMSVSEASPSQHPYVREVHDILRDVPLIDGHNDLPWQYRKRSNDFSAIRLEANNSSLTPPLVTDIPRLRAGGIGGQFWSVYVPAELPGSEAV